MHNAPALPIARHWTDQLRLSLPPIAARVVAGHHLPMREPTRFVPLVGEDGQKLYAEVFQAEAAKGVVLVTHGYAEHCGRYRELADVLVRAGWSVLTWDVRGHGQSAGRRGYCDRFSQFLSDFRAAHSAARALGDGPLVALGHSHGSLITLRALMEASAPAVAAAVVSSPFLGFGTPVPAIKAAMGKVASFLAPTLALPNGLRIEDLTSDEGKRAERRKDTLCFDIATARWFTEATRAHQEVDDGASRIQVPTLWLIGGADVIANPSQSRKVAAKMPHATIKLLEGLKHEVFNETERARVFNDLTSFLEGVS